MIRYYCDNCDTELNEDNPDMLNPRLKRSVEKWYFELKVSRNGTSNDGNLCRKCLCELVMKVIGHYEKSGE